MKVYFQSRYGEFSLDLFSYSSCYTHGLVSHLMCNFFVALFFLIFLFFFFFFLPPFFVLKLSSKAFCFSWCSLRQGIESSLKWVSAAPSSNQPQMRTVNIALIPPVCTGAGPQHSRTSRPSQQWMRHVHDESQLKKNQTCHFFSYFSTKSGESKDTSFNSSTSKT